MNKKLLNTRELAEYLDINEKKIYSLILEKGLPSTKVTGIMISIHNFNFQISTKSDQASRILTL